MDVQDEGEEGAEGGEDDEVVRRSGVGAEGGRLSKVRAPTRKRTAGVALPVLVHVRDERIVGLVLARGGRV